ncbi:hypothetical protein NDU88_006063 [Pleurodeles waltl]|uniref:Uncharacterized protein n=1 Tax=Pleurodeles waltl TaxID=8319 RepID=A0AAV7QGW2_PLEWA|nr:hypothetical protein NDU88_006063 [Pleurodeles waltl]
MSIGSSRSPTIYDIPCTNRFLPLGALHDLLGIDKLEQGVETSSHQPIRVPHQEEMGNDILSLREEINELRQVMKEVLSLLRQPERVKREQGTQKDRPAPVLPIYEKQRATTIESHLKPDVKIRSPLATASNYESSVQKRYIPAPCPERVDHANCL